MTTTHNHSHMHAPGSGSAVNGKAQTRLLLAIGVTVGILALEAVGGVIANSLALLSDAGHVLTDLAALIISFVALRLAARPATPDKTYGYHRFEILSALVNGVTLVAVSLFIFVEAYRRLRDPQPVLGREVFIVAVLGLIGNGSAAWLLHGAGKSLNLRGAFLHVVGDAVSSVGVILSGIVIMLTGWWVVDPLVGIGIGLIIIRGAVGLIDESVHVLLEGTPRHIDLKKVTAAMAAVPGVCSVHDVHVWCVTPQLCMLSGHIVLEAGAQNRSSAIRRQISSIMEHTFGISHSTIQVEHEHCGQDDARWLAQV